MPIAWLVTLVIYGLVVGWDQVRPLDWWLILSLTLHNALSHGSKK